MNFTLSSSILLLSTCVAGMSHAEPLTVYGKTNVSAQSSDDGNGSFTELKSNASRVGVKGDWALDNDIEIIYKLEWQVDITDNSGSENIKSRNQYLGIKGNFGTVLLGRNDTMLKQKTGSIDLFNDYEGDIKVLYQGENRMSNSFTYESPSFNGFGFGISYIADDEVDADDGVSAAVYYGDAKFAKSSWFASLAVDADVNGYDVQRALVQTKIGDWILGVLAQKQEAVDSNNSDSGFTASAQYSINKWTLKAQYQTLEDDDIKSIGVDYKLAASTKAYAWYSNQGLAESRDKSWLALGLVHKF